MSSSFNLSIATVVQLGLGHQIANLVTRVQIPAVACERSIGGIDPQLVVMQTILQLNTDVRYIISTSVENDYDSKLPTEYSTLATYIGVK